MAYQKKSSKKKIKVDEMKAFPILERFFLFTLCNKCYSKDGIMFSLFAALWLCVGILKYLS